MYKYLIVQVFHGVDGKGSVHLETIYRTNDYADACEMLTIYRGRFPEYELKLIDAVYN